MLPLVNYHLKEKEVAEAVATPSRSKKKTPAKKSTAATTSATVATNSSFPPQTPVSAGMEALRKDQDKHNERMTTMESATRDFGKIDYSIVESLCSDHCSSSFFTT
ncbi:hypothetical protein PanWU01x14_001520 [Parasponia andersonii]|uniref:Uncharacterized protein n=1 Tax=Parasponia andersonii TaxID=3476 RepID=A0A2P5E4Y2_PARAD|nr:hypothetical protein PanWU01x14_001520 [Parasponia andersonii]